jgi:DNA-directed RNA polymerase specialized sigma24 family protein
MMSNGYVYPVDPAQLANRPTPFEDPLEVAEQLASVTDEVAELLNPSYEAQIVPLLPRIPKREADLLEMYFLKKKRQADIAIIFGVTQAAISYRLDRGIQRIKFLLSIPNVTEEDLRGALPLAFNNQIDIDILVGMWQTTCQSEVAEKLGLTQGLVRHRFFRAVKTLKKTAETDPRLEPYSRVFTAISSKKFNILREVKLPQWAGRGGDECA